MRRLAYLEVTWELLENVLKHAFGGFNPKQAGECFACYIYRIGLEDVASSLGFPEDARVVRAATMTFGRVALLIESPDFRTAPEGSTIPKVEAVYTERGFSHWENDAAVVSDYIKHCDRPAYRPRNRWWLKEESWRNRPSML